MSTLYVNTSFCIFEAFNIYSLCKICLLGERVVYIISGCAKIATVFKAQWENESEHLLKVPTIPWAVYRQNQKREIHKFTKENSEIDSWDNT